MVEVIDETSRFPHASELARVMEELMAELDLETREVTIALLDDDAISRHNAADRGVEGPTDVLSYPTWEPDGLPMPEVAHLGDILISVETAERQAKEHGHRLIDEVVVLAAHGLTHLRGFDHPTEESWKIFREVQQRALELLPHRPEA